MIKIHILGNLSTFVAAGVLQLCLLTYLPPFQLLWPSCTLVLLGAALDLKLRLGGPQLHLPSSFNHHHYQGELTEAPCHNQPPQCHNAKPQQHPSYCTLLSSASPVTFCSNHPAGLTNLHSARPTSLAALFSTHTAGVYGSESWTLVLKKPKKKKKRVTEQINPEFSLKSQIIIILFQNIMETMLSGEAFNSGKGG